MPFETLSHALPVAIRIGRSLTAASLFLKSSVFSLALLAALAVSPASAAAPTYLLSEGFEGPGYENSGWIVPAISTSAPEPDHTNLVLSGSQSLRCNGVSFIQRPFERVDPMYCYLRVRWASWADYKFVIDWLDAAQSSTATLLTSFGNKLEIKHGSVSVPGTTTIALNTTYHVWVEWTRGSGTDGTMKLFISEDGTKPASPEVFIANGNGTSTALFDVGPFAAGVDVIYDSILIDDEPIGSDPDGNAPPSITGISNQFTPESTPLDSIPFTIGDVETNAADLTVTGVSSNQDLIPDSNIIISGSESNRAVTLTPVLNLSGITTITLTVSDGRASASTSFAVTVGSFNSPPTISAIANQSTVKNTATAPIPFVVDDAQTNAGSLIVTATSSNTNLVPDSNIVLGGTSSNRTVVLNPSPDETGISTITLFVTDGELTNSTSFTVTVNTPNSPPSISAFSGQIIQQDSILGPINFTIGDAETSAGALLLSSASNNPDLIPVTSIAFSGTNADRAVTITPIPGQFGVSTITIMVSDGELTVSRSFLVTVLPTGTGTPGGLLFEEGFEGPGYEYSGWSEIGLPDPDYTNEVLRGSHSLNLTGGEFLFRTFVATNQFNLYLRARWNVWEDYTSIIYFESANFETVGSLFADNNILQINHGNASLNGTTPIEQDTTYHIWLEWIRGEGTNGTFNLFVSTNVIKPSLPEASISTGTGGAIERIYFGAFSTEFDVIMDSLFIDDETIGSNPLGNQAPEISAISDQTIDEDAATAAVDFTIGDIESSVSSLTLAGFSSDTNLVPVANIVFGGSESNRTVTVTPAPNQTGTATITVQVRDNALTSNTTFQVTVNPVNDAPEVSLPGEPAEYVEGSAPVLISANASVIDIDSPTLGGGQLIVSILENGAEEDRLTIRNQGSGPGEIEVSGIGVSYEGVGIGTFDGGTNGTSPLVIAFTAGATPAAAQALLRNVNFSTLSEMPSILPRTIQVIATDGQGGTSIPATNTVNVISVAENPVINWPFPEPITYGTTISELQLNASANVPGVFAYSPTNGTILSFGADQPLTVVFSPTDSVNFNSVTGSVPITVTPAPLVVTANATNRVYGSANPAFTATFTGFVNGDDETSLDAPVTFSTLADAASPVGSYDIIPAGAADLNYSITFSNALLAVTPAALLVTANNTNRVYGETNPLFTVTFTGFANSDDIGDLDGALAFATPAETNSPVGQYAITPSGLTATNYTITFAEGTLTVTAFTLVVTADNQSKLYGAEPPTLTGTLAGLQEGDDITATFTTTATATNEVGLYPITPVLNDPNNLLTNYAVTIVNGTLTNLPAPLLVSANPTNRVYGSANPVFTATFTGFVNGDAETSLDAPVTFSTLADAASPVGSYDIIPAGTADLNYSITFSNALLAVTPAALLVTANNTNRVYGETNPLFTATFTGFANGDDITDLDGTLAFATLAETNSPVDQYAITPSGLTATNYSITFADGTLTVTPAALLVTANNTNRVYGETNPLFTATFTGFANDDDITDLDGTLAFATLAETNSSIGQYAITPSGLTATNYTITFADGTLTVTAPTSLMLALVSVDPAGNVTLRVTSTPGQRVKIQMSSDLTAWDDLTTLDNVTGTMDYTDPGEPNRPKRFYRAVLEPSTAE